MFAAAVGAWAAFLATGFPAPLGQSGFISGASLVRALADCSEPRRAGRPAAELAELARPWAEHAACIRKSPIQALASRWSQAQTDSQAFVGRAGAPGQHLARDLRSVKASMARACCAASVHVQVPSGASCVSSRSRGLSGTVRPCIVRTVTAVGAGGPCLAAGFPAHARAVGVLLLVPSAPILLAGCLPRGPPPAPPPAPARRQPRRAGCPAAQVARPWTQEAKAPVDLGATLVLNPSGMFEHAGVVAEFVFSQLPTPKDTLAIIDGLLAELPGTAWARANLWPEALVREMRRQSYQANSSTFLAEALDIIIDRSAPRAPKRRRTLLDQRNVATRERHAHGQRVQKLKQDCEEYAVKASKVGNEYHRLVQKTRLRQRRARASCPSCCCAQAVRTAGAHRHTACGANNGSSCTSTCSMWPRARSTYRPC